MHTWRNGSVSSALRRNGMMPGVELGSAIQTASQRCRTNLSSSLGFRESQKPKAKSQKPSSHTLVIRPTAALRRHPGDDLVRIHDVAGLAVHTVRRIQVDLQTAWRVGGFDHLIDTGRAEVLARIAEFLHATLIANVRVTDDQVPRLIFLMLRAGVIDVGELVESELTVAFR